MRYIYLLFIVSLIFSPDLLLGQDPNPSYQLYIRTGGNVDFNIRRMDQYENAGIKLNSWTTLKMVYSDTTAGRDEFKIGFRVENTNFESSYTSNFPNDYLSLEVEAGSYDSLEVNSSLNTGKKSLSTSWKDIATGVKEGEYQFDLHYYQDSSLINRGPGYFTNILIFDIAPQGENYEY